MGEEFLVQKGLEKLSRQNHSAGGRARLGEGRPATQSPGCPSMGISSHQSSLPRDSKPWGGLVLSPACSKAW